jgi:hypothetical protein
MSLSRSTDLPKLTRLRADALAVNRDSLRTAVREGLLSSSRHPPVPWGRGALI